MTGCKEFSVRAEDIDDITFSRFPYNLGHRSGKNPRMKSLERLFPTFFQYYL